MKEYPAAVADFTRAIELQPEAGYIYYWRGRTYWEMKEYPAAVADLSKAIELQPEDAYNYAWRGRIYLTLNDITRAQSDFAQVETLLGEAGRPAYYVAAGYAALSQVEEACTWLRRAFERDSDLVGEIETEVEFDPVREATAFQSLLAEFREAAEKD